jgi:alcohol dehydrogenase
MLMKLVDLGKLGPSQLITHRKLDSFPRDDEPVRSDFKFSEMEEAYKTFGKAAEHGVLNVVIDLNRVLGMRME